MWILETVGIPLGRSHRCNRHAPPPNGVIDAAGSANSSHSHLGRPPHRNRCAKSPRIERVGASPPRYTLPTPVPPHGATPSADEGMRRDGEWVVVGTSIACSDTSRAMNRLAAIVALVPRPRCSCDGPRAAGRRELPLQALHQTGVIPSNGLNVDYDPQTKETLVFGDGRVRVFNPTGMEIFSFGDDPELGWDRRRSSHRGWRLPPPLPTSRTAPRWSAPTSAGELKQRIGITGLPPEIPQPFRPNGMGYARQRIYLVDLGAMRLVVLDMEGRFVAYHDLAKLCEVAGKAGRQRGEGLPGGAERRLPLHRPAALQGLRALGRRHVPGPSGSKGSAPGKFNIISGIAVDEQGYYYVTDILKSAVLVFDKNFRWLKEFGYRGNEARQPLRAGGRRRRRREGLRLPVRAQGRERLRGRRFSSSLIAGLGGPLPMHSTYRVCHFGGTRDMGDGGARSLGVFTQKVGHQNHVPPTAPRTHGSEFQGVTWRSVCAWAGTATAQGPRTGVMLPDIRKWEAAPQFNLRGDTR